ncbi:hypothetical protein D3C76_28070 [compost metagenome]
MLSILLTLGVIILCVYYIMASFDDYRRTKDRVMLCFCTLFTLALLAIVYGFMHFKPWIN